MADERILLEYIRDSVALIQEYTAEGEAAFLSDQRTQDAVLRRMETLADAAGKLSDEVKVRHPAIPWRDITAFRNVLAHAYSEIRLDRVWEAVQAVVGDRLEVRFLPPEHGRSLAGSLRRYAKGRTGDYGAEKREAWVSGARDEGAPEGGEGTTGRGIS